MVTMIVGVVMFAVGWYMSRFNEERKFWKAIHQQEVKRYHTQKETQQ